MSIIILLYMRRTAVHYFIKMNKRERNSLSNNVVVLEPVLLT